MIVFLPYLSLGTPINIILLFSTYYTNIALHSTTNRAIRTDREFQKPNEPTILNRPLSGSNRVREPGKDYKWSSSKKCMIT